MTTPKHTPTPCCIHGAKSTTPIASLSPAKRAAMVRDTAMRQGWAYATVQSAPDVRVVTDSQGGMQVGQTHMHMDCYTLRALEG